jgi:hypothetical protein
MGWVPPVTELEVLRRRRDLVLLSAQLQRATIVRRIEHVEHHPVPLALGLAASAAPVPIVKFGPARLGHPVHAYRPYRPGESPFLRRQIRRSHALLGSRVLHRRADRRGPGLRWHCRRRHESPDLFFIFLVAFVVSLLMGVFRRGV